MPFSNLFQRLTSGQSASVSAKPKAAQNRKILPTDPASLGRIIAIAKFFRRKDLLAETDPTWLATFERLAVFDDETGHWKVPPGFTQGDAEALQARLYALPYKGKAEPEASPVETSQAQPIRNGSVLPSAPAVPAKPEPDIRSLIASAVAEAMEAYVDTATAPERQLIPEGYELRTGKKGPYIAKIR